MFLGRRASRGPERAAASARTTTARTELRSPSSPRPSDPRAPAEPVIYVRTRSTPLQIESLIRVIPDFPIPGILFRDITPLLKDAVGFRTTIDLFVERFEHERIDYVVAVEARGYMIGAPLAYRLGAGFIPVRKPGKLPGDTLTESYALEYGTNSLEIHDDAVRPGERVLVVDDLLATGGTAAATGRLLDRVGAEVVGFAFLIELAALGGRAALGERPITAFITY